MDGKAGATEVVAAGAAAESWDQMYPTPVAVQLLRVAAIAEASNQSQRFQMRRLPDTKQR